MSNEVTGSATDKSLLVRLLSHILSYCRELGLPQSERLHDAIE